MFHYMLFWLTFIFANWYFFVHKKTVRKLTFGYEGKLKTTNKQKTTTNLKKKLKTKKQKPGAWRRGKFFLSLTLPGLNFTKK